MYIMCFFTRACSPVFRDHRPSKNGEWNPSWQIERLGNLIYSISYPLKQLNNPELDKAELKWQSKQIRKYDMVYTAFQELSYFFILIYFSVIS